MADPTDLSADIAQQAVEPISTTADGQSVTGRSITEAIEADKYLAAKAAAKSKRRGVTFSKLIPPGASGIDCSGPNGV